MADMGRLVVQTITSTLCEQFGPAIREPQSILTNPHHQLGTQMVGGAVHWQAAVNGGPLTVTFVLAPSITTTSHQSVAPTPFSLPPIEDGSEVTGLPIPLPNPFPGPVVPGMATSSLHQMLPNHIPLPVPQRTTTGPDVSRPQDGPLATFRVDLSTVGYGPKALVSSSQMRAVATYSFTNPLSNLRMLTLSK